MLSAVMLPSENVIPEMFKFERNAWPEMFKLPVIFRLPAIVRFPEIVSPDLFTNKDATWVLL